MYICIANITLSSSSTSSHLFDIILDYDVLQAWTCPQCPLPLSPNEHERLYDGINEVHIADGINMGTTAALKELETNEIFCEDKIKGPCGTVKGIYARERTFLALKAERLLIRRTGLIVVQSSHAPGLKAIFEKYDRGVDDDDDKFCDDDDSLLLYCKFCCMTTKYVGIAYKFCISIDHLMFYVQNKLVRKKVFFILSCFYRTIVLKPKKKKEKVADLNLDVPTFQSLIATFHSNTWAIASNWFRFAECCLMQSFHSNNIFSIVTLPFEQSTSFAITFSFGSTYFPLTQN